MAKPQKQAVYDYLLTIPRGKVVTYAQIGDALGNRFLARWVGRVLHQNPDGDKYPCYKVVNAEGRLAPLFVFGGEEEQRLRLQAEGIEVEEGRVDLRKYLWDGKTI